MAALHLLRASLALRKTFWIGLKGKATQKLRQKLLSDSSCNGFLAPPSFTNGPDCSPPPQPGSAYKMTAFSLKPLLSNRLPKGLGFNLLPVKTLIVRTEAEHPAATSAWESAANISCMVFKRIWQTAVLSTCVQEPGQEQGRHSMVCSTWTWNSLTPVLPWRQPACAQIEGCVQEHFSNRKSVKKVSHFYQSKLVADTLQWGRFWNTQTNPPSTQRSSPRRCHHGEEERRKWDPAGGLPDPPRITQGSASLAAEPQFLLPTLGGTELCVYACTGGKREDGRTSRCLGWNWDTDPLCALGHKKAGKEKWKIVEWVSSGFGAGTVRKRWQGFMITHALLTWNASQWASLTGPQLVNAASWICGTNVNALGCTNAFTHFKLGDEFYMQVVPVDNLLLSTKFW